MRILSQEHHSRAYLDWCQAMVEFFAAKAESDSADEEAAIWSAEAAVACA